MKFNVYQIEMVHGCYGDIFFYRHLYFDILQTQMHSRKQEESSGGAHGR